MAGGDHRAVEAGRPVMAGGPQAQVLVARLQIRDVAIFEHGYPVVLLLGPRHQRQELGAEIMAQQHARQKLAVVQRLFLHPIAGQEAGGLRAQPLEIGTGERRDLNAGDVGEHGPVIGVLVVGHAHTGVLARLIKRDGKRRLAGDQGGEGIEAGRPGADNGDALHTTVISL
jgi:hypothetical protein